MNHLPKYVEIPKNNAVNRISADTYLKEINQFPVLDNNRIIELYMGIEQIHNKAAKILSALSGFIHEIVFYVAYQKKFNRIFNSRNKNNNLREIVLGVQYVHSSEKYFDIVRNAVNCMFSYDLYKIKDMVIDIIEKKKTFGESINQVKKCIVQRDEYIEQIYNSNLRHVPNIAKNYLDMGVSFSDLIQQGNIALLSIVNRFDYHKDVLFKTYSYDWITSFIKKYIKDQSRNVRITRNKINDAYRMNRVSGEIQKTLEGKHSLEELCEKIGMDIESATELLIIMKDEVSLDENINDSKVPHINAVCYPNQPSALDIVLNNELADVLMAKINTFQENKQKILKMRYGIGGEYEHTLQEVGDFKGLSRERIRQIVKEMFTELSDDPKILELYNAIPKNHNSIQINHAM